MAVVQTTIHKVNPPICMIRAHETVPGHYIFASLLYSKWMVHKSSLPSVGLNLSVMSTLPYHEFSRWDLKDSEVLQSCLVFPISMYCFISVCLISCPVCDRIHFPIWNLFVCVYVHYLKGPRVILKVKHGTLVIVINIQNRFTERENPRVYY